MNICSQTAAKIRGNLRYAVLYIAASVLSPLTVDASTIQLITNAEIRMIMFNSGSVSDENAALLAEYGIELGGQIVTSVTFDTTVTPSIDTSYGAVTASYNAIVNAEYQLPGLSGDFDLSLPSAYYITDRMTGSADVIGVVAREQIEVSQGTLSFRVSSQLFDPTGTSVSSLSLDPSAFLDLSVWESFDEGRRTGSFLTIIFPNDEVARVYAEFTQNDVVPVPIPGAIMLYLCGIAGLVSWKRCMPFQTD